MTGISDPLAESDALLAQGDAAGAATLLRRLLGEGRGGLLTRLQLGRALVLAGDVPGALEVLREAVALAPDIPAAALALGDALLAAGHLPTAIAEYQRASRLDPESQAARLKLAQAWLEAGEAVRAKDILFRMEADPEWAKDIAEALTRADAMDAAPRSSAKYVRHLFDQFSTDYDSRMLGPLAYRAHLILRELADLTLGPAAARDILDLGCGTGLAGERFRDLAKTLDGIDLSPQMVASAARRKIYDRLAVADLEDERIFDNARYDLVIAADTLVYLGDLRPAFAAAAQRLKPHGFFLFTVEREDRADACFVLGPKRRWRHSARYLREEVARAGFDIAGLVECSPRVEAGVPVAGWAAALQLRTGASPAVL